MSRQPFKRFDLTPSNPRSPQTCGTSLGEALERAGKTEEALASYRKALSLAEASGDSRLETIRQTVFRLSEVLKTNKK
jgi:hypothetical protein